jgi:hypothetical protein
MTAREHAERASRALAECERWGDEYAAADPMGRLEMEASGIAPRMAGLREAAKVHALTSLALLAVDGLLPVKLGAAPEDGR